MRFAVTVVSPPGYIHSQAFSEIAAAVHHGLVELGHDSVLSTRLDNRRRRHIVFGAHLLLRHPQPVAADSVLFNLEQVVDGSKWIVPGYLDLLRRHPVWDYSQANAEALAAHGIATTLVPIGYVARLARIVPAATPDIDVLFYGSINPRRQRILDALRERGLAVHAAFGVYGAARDALIARSRLVLNLHFYESKVFEIVRVSYLLANGVCVVSETGSDPALEAPFADGVAFAGYDDLVGRCSALLADADRRRTLAARGQALFAAMPMATGLARALGSSAA
jgi:hypothetical protein